MRVFDSIAIGLPEILLPVEGIDLIRWAVIACDQYTSEPEYWQKVENFVGSSPSTLHLIYPEVYLNAPDKEIRIAKIQATMKEYLSRGIFRSVEGPVYVERETAHGIRKGLLLAVDLEKYDYQPGASSLIRATEGTILDRIPPRVKIREGAALEVPHIMILIDDETNSVIGPVTDHKNEFQLLYDFDLMFDSGRVSGYLVNQPRVEKMIINGLENLVQTEKFCQKYNLPEGTPPLLFAMGDGNHSLATAKTIWEKVKNNLKDSRQLQNSPLRYALVEVVNLHDESLVFEPIHRVLFEVIVPEGFEKDFEDFFNGAVQIKEHHSFEQLRSEVNSKKKNEQVAGIIYKDSYKSVRFLQPVYNLTVGTLQNFLDDYLQKKAASGVDYVHGDDSLINIIKKKERSIGFYLPAMDKNEFFRTVILDGALPRKTFSLGEAWEKRFYLEARKLID
ncbi:MAG: DUF1015 domain-containing protein [Candidatus Saccharicenans sp.]|nr:MAG: DUF1015 domain-containing protein [Candidatus Aminicenantes bacterium]HEK85339.1 DUF1015 domain-containing protein [Candidatus Aminicenantes bacterium]